MKVEEVMCQNGSNGGGSKKTPVSSQFKHGRINSVHLRVYTDMMRLLKQRELWSSNAKLAEKKGKWINGNSSMKSSQTYPKLFGVAVILETLNPLNPLAVLNGIRDRVIAQLQQQHDQDSWSVWFR